MEIEYTGDWFKKNADKIDLWFDAETFSWYGCSWLLARHCSKYFELWWDSDKFNKRDYSYCLARDCSKYFDIWWDGDKYDWDYHDLLVDFCWDFKHIWGQDKDGRDIIFHHLRGNHGSLPISKVDG